MNIVETMTVREALLILSREALKENDKETLKKIMELQEFALGIVKSK